MRRALGRIVDFVELIGLAWLVPLAILLIGLPIIAIVRVVAAAVRLAIR